MNWKNTEKDELPEDMEEVLISVDGVYYISTYHAQKKTFTVENELQETFFKVGERQIYWVKHGE